VVRRWQARLVLEIVERADGVPLFVEELTKAVVEARGSTEGIEKTLAGALSVSTAVPSVLHAPLMARLDRLGPGPKEVAQIAAAIGREFSYDLLAPIAGRGENDLAVALGRLGDEGLVFARGTPPEATYLFKHALVRDAAYESLQRRRREELHAQIAAVLESDFSDIVEGQPEFVAQHFTEAGLTERAVAYWQRAGEHAAARSANLEAIAHFGRGIEVLKNLPENQARDERELMLRLASINPVWASRGFGSAEAERAAASALLMALGRVTANPRLFAVRDHFDLLPVLPDQCRELVRLLRRHRDPFDRMLIAQARTEHLALVTRDGAIVAYGAAGADVVTFDN